MKLERIAISVPCNKIMKDKILLRAVSEWLDERACGCVVILMMIIFQGLPWRTNSKICKQLVLSFMRTKHLMFTGYNKQISTITRVRSLIRRPKANNALQLTTNGNIE